MLSDALVPQLLVHSLSLEVLLPHAEPHVLEPLLPGRGLEFSREDVSGAEALVLRVDVQAFVVQ